MSFSHLSIIERGQLETLHRLGWSTRAIARHLGRHHSTLSREVQRGRMEEGYKAEPAQQAYQERRALSVPAGKYSPELAKELSQKLSEAWSPEQIAAKRRVEGKTAVCFKTIPDGCTVDLLQPGGVALSLTNRHTENKGNRHKTAKTERRYNVA